MRRLLRLGTRIGLVAGVGWLVQRTRRRRFDLAPATAPRTGTPPSAPMPVVQPAVVEVGDVSQPGEPELDTAAAAAADADAAAWVVPEPGGACPASHPVKAKLRSKLFHLPGMAAYERTNPDRCYRDEAAAEADGLTRAKR